MSRKKIELSTGLPGLDQVFQGIRPGDNIVWQLDSIRDYLPFVQPYSDFAAKHEQKLVYFRFAEHDALVAEAKGVEIHHLRPERGFEPFIKQLHRVIDSVPAGTFLFFDCLSGLAANWQSDRMLGNFFTLASAYVRRREAIAYFSLFRDYHSFHALDPICATAEILCNVYHHEEKLFIHPIKVENRHSPTLFTLHVHEDGDFLPVTQSCVITEILSDIQWSRLGASAYTLGFWSKTFSEAERVQENIIRGLESPDIARVYFHKLLHMLISHDEPVLELADKYFSLQDLLNIRRRMIGTGRIGGKSVGMLLARAILTETDSRWKDILECHDSFYVGSDVFYTYLVSNGYWWQVKDRVDALAESDDLGRIRQDMHKGSFPDSVVKQFSDMLDYFGQAPIIVRSSSLLEDNFGNAFAGKYESVFCANQGSHDKRLEEFLEAVRTIYASVISDEALAYRTQWKLLEREEQMGLLIQRVSGSMYDKFFYPQAAGVGFSFNPYVWHKDIDPDAGMLRLVFGLGTRAVDRNDDDYTRIVALNAPTRRPEVNTDEVREYAQRQVDVLDLEENKLVVRSFKDISADSPELPLDYFASRDRKMERRMKEQKLTGFFPWVLTFDKLLSHSDFVSDLRQILSTLRRAYNYPVDIEFTLNFFGEEQYKINIVQCRPLQVRSVGTVTEVPDNIAQANVLFQSEGPVIGTSRALGIEHVICVIPSVYSNLSISNRYQVARFIGELTKHSRLASASIMLLGPGRWGTKSPELGVPVSFAEIHRVSVLCEIVAMHEKLVPDASLGTHFFNELVENDILYLALTPGSKNNSINEKFFEKKLKNKSAELLQSDSPVIEAIKVYDITELPQGSLILNANAVSQKVLCYLDTSKS